MTQATQGKRPITDGQKRQMWALCEQKGIDYNQFQRLLNSGLMADFLIADPHLMVRNEFRRECGLLPLGKYSYPRPPSYDMAYNLVLAVRKYYSFSEEAITLAESLCAKLEQQTDTSFIGGVPANLGHYHISLDSLYEFFYPLVQVVGKLKNSHTEPGDEQLPKPVYVAEAVALCESATKDFPQDMEIQALKTVLWRVLVGEPQTDQRSIDPNEPLPAHIVTCYHVLKEQLDKCNVQPPTVSDAIDLMNSVPVHNILLISLANGLNKVLAMQLGNRYELAKVELTGEALVIFNLMKQHLLK